MQISKLKELQISNVFAYVTLFDCCPQPQLGTARFPTKESGKQLKNRTRYLARIFNLAVHILSISLNVNRKQAISPAEQKDPLSQYNTCRYFQQYVLIIRPAI